MRNSLENPDLSFLVNKDNVCKIKQKIEDLFDNNLSFAKTVIQKVNTKIKFLVNRLKDIKDYN